MRTVQMSSAPVRSRLALLLLASACGASDPRVGTEPAWVAPPASADVVAFLHRHGDLEILGSQPGCDSVFGAPVDRFTVEEYVAFLLKTVEENAAEGSTAEAGCAPDGSVWACSLWVSVGTGGDSPWRYGLLFRVSGSPPAIDPASFECPGGA